MSSTEIELDIGPVLEYYGCINPPNGPGWRSLKCPFHEDSVASARSNGKGFACHGCGMKGSALSLLMEREYLDYQGSILKYEEITGTSHESLRATKTWKRRKPLSDEPRDYERNSGIFSLGLRRRPASGA